MKRQAAQAVTCARCAAVVSLEAEHCGICWFPVSASLPEQVESPIDVVDPTVASETAEDAQPEQVAEVAEVAHDAPVHEVAVPVEAIEHSDDYITEQIPVVLVAAGDVNGSPMQVWAPLPGTPLPGPNPFGTSFTG